MSEREQRRLEERKAPKKQVVITPKETPAPMPLTHAEPQPPPQVIRPLPRPSAAPISDREDEPAPIVPKRKSKAAQEPPAQTSFPPTALLHASIARTEVNEDELRDDECENERPSW